MLKKLISSITSISLISLQTLQAVDIQIDKKAPLKNQATLLKAPNGVEVINIVKPNASGLSHNIFKKFNVTKKGVILNNSNKALA